MTEDSNALLEQTIHEIFTGSERTLPKHAANLEGKRGKKRAVKELELALAVLLVDLASCDQAFDMQEYVIISNGLRRLFGTNKSDVRGLINQANLVLSNLRGTAKFSQLLQESLSEDEKRAVLEVIDEVIFADGVEDGFETYLRNKFMHALGLSTDLPTNKN